MKNRYLDLYFGHLGTILSNMSVFGLVVSIALLAVPLLWGLLGILLIFILMALTLFTFGTIWVSESNRQFIGNIFNQLSFEKSTELLNTFVNYLPLIAGITCGLTVLSLILLYFDKKNIKSKKRFNLNFVILALIAIVFVAYFVLRNIK